MTQWVVTMEGSDGLKFRDFFEGSSYENVKLAAEQYFTNATFVDAELMSEDTW